MAVVVLLRGANLGARRFSPKAVESALEDLDVVSVGAAGTFVVRKRVAAGALRARVMAELPFSPAPMILARGLDVLEAVAAGDDITVPAGARRFATAMEGGATPKLPVEAPGVTIARVVGAFALGTRRPLREASVYPNAVVEKAFGCGATTRDWPTMERVAALLR